MNNKSYHYIPVNMQLRHTIHFQLSFSNIICPILVIRFLLLCNTYHQSDFVHRKSGLQFKLVQLSTGGTEVYDFNLITISTTITLYWIQSFSMQFENISESK